MYKQFIKRIVQNVQASRSLEDFSSIFQNCIESSVSSVLVYDRKKERNNTSNECLRSKVDYVRKNLSSTKRKNSKPQSIVSFLDYSLSKKAKSPNSKDGAIIRNKKSPLNMKELESYIGLAQFFGQLIPVLQQNVYL